MTAHGGNIYRFSESSGMPLRNVTDFSASINPLGVPKSVSAAIKDAVRMLQHYPDPDAKDLTIEIARHFRVRPESIICGNGSTELIYLTARALKPRNVLIPSPTFSEYERACKISCKPQVASYKLKRENNFDIDTDEFIKVLSGEKNSSLVARRSSLPFNMAFLCNPNNPTGRLIRKKEMQKIAEAAKKTRCFLVVDEAFIDFCPEDSVIGDVKKNPYLIVLRSMTKFYALSGLRLGYGVFPLQIIEYVKRHKEPWTVNSLAQIAGVAALRDKAYKDKTRKLINKEKRFLERGFAKLGISFIESEANYYLLKTERTLQIRARLMKKGILARECSNFRGLDATYIRVAVKSRRENALLLRELSNTARE